MEGELSPPQVGKHYWHYKGTIYTVVANAIFCDGPDEGEPCVVYQKKDDDGMTFVRSLRDWHAPTDSGEVRFTRA